MRHLKKAINIAVFSYGELDDPMICYNLQIKQ